jgi:predicted metal-dependent HD superfamily phosphohydrolase
MASKKFFSKKRWLTLWSQIGAKGNGAVVFKNLAALYAEPHRAYHNASHIAACLGEFDHSKYLAKSPAAVQMALWFHDAIYDPQAKDNEEQSFRFFLREVRQAALPKEFILKVRQLILATRHRRRPTSPDARLVVDIDLSILGRSPQKFTQYERQIRQEYAWVSPQAFAAGRSTILQAFLGRRIYSTRHFFQRYEAPARRNLVHSLATLARKSEITLRRLPQGRFVR